MHTTNSAEVFQAAGFRGRPAIIIGTGPSLDISSVRRAQENGAKLFGINNTFNDFDLDCWIACDPAWHDVYSPVVLDCDQWHWDKNICEQHNYYYIEGRWGEGLSTDPAYIHYGHSSAFQALNLALHYGCSPLLLVGFDMRYGEGERHYFSGLSGEDGEYPERLRKFSDFDKPHVTTGNPKDYGLFQYYQTVADQKGLPPIINCTPNSALTCFEFGALCVENLYCSLNDPSLYRQH